ncbi:hypothetical protein [Candidatus Endomicrobiellum trichonymphae]|uniref:hypothetical protein n=1 Tax=Endomicrobium trichonymphae TaxID=1408204 RepID=UPI0039B84DD4
MFILTVKSRVEEMKKEYFTPPPPPRHCICQNNHFRVGIVTSRMNLAPLFQISQTPLPSYLTHNIVITDYKHALTTQSLSPISVFEIYG